MLKITKYFRTLTKTKQPPKPQIRKKGISTRRISLLAMTAFLSYMIYHHRRSIGSITYMMHDSKLNKEIIRNNRLLNQEEYMPSIVMPFGGIQLLWAKYIQTRTNIKYEKQEIVENCELNYVAKASYDKNRDISNRPCIIIVGGSEGSNQLIKSSMLNLSSNSFEAISINMDDIFDTAKLTRIIRKIKQQRKGVHFHGVGVQYGANLLVLAAANNPELFNSIMLVGNPFDLNKAQQKVQQSIFAKLTFLDNIKKNRIQKSQAKIPLNTPLPQLTKLIYNIPTEQQALKFKQNNSSINYIQKLKIPSLFLNSKQDPFSIDISEDQRIQSNPNAIFVTTKDGGHNQWFQSLNVTRYAPRLMVMHFKTIQKLIKQSPDLVHPSPSKPIEPTS